MIHKINKIIAAASINKNKRKYDVLEQRVTNARNREIIRPKKKKKKSLRTSLSPSGIKKCAGVEKQRSDREGRGAKQ